MKAHERNIYQISASPQPNPPAQPPLFLEVVGVSRAPFLSLSQYIAA